MDFDRDQHQYSKDGKIYLSVSEFLDRFEEPFAKGLLAQRIAQKEGRDAEDVIAQWDLNAEISRDYGNSIHKAIEYWIRFGQYPKAPHLRLAVEKFEEKFPSRDLIKPEIIVFNEEYGLAGTIDQLQILGKNGKGQTRVRVIDVKTNGELETKARGYFHAPIDKLPHSKLNRYRLQLNTYKHLLELKNFEVVDMLLEHWTGSDMKQYEIEPMDMAPLCQTLVGGTGTNIHSKKVVRI